MPHHDGPVFNSRCPTLVVLTVLVAVGRVALFCRRRLSGDRLTERESRKLFEHILYFGYTTLLSGVVPLVTSQPSDA